MIKYNLQRGQIPILDCSCLMTTFTLHLMVIHTLQKVKDIILTDHIVKQLLRVTAYYKGSLLVLKPKSKLQSSVKNAGIGCLKRFDPKTDFL